MFFGLIKSKETFAFEEEIKAQVPKIEINTFDEFVEITNKKIELFKKFEHKHATNKFAKEIFLPIIAAQSNFLNSLSFPDLKIDLREFNESKQSFIFEIELKKDNILKTEIVLEQQRLLDLKLKYEKLKDHIKIEEEKLAKEKEIQTKETKEKVKTIASNFLIIQKEVEINSKHREDTSCVIRKNTLNELLGNLNKLNLDLINCENKSKELNLQNEDKIKDLKNNFDSINKRIIEITALIDKALDAYKKNSQNELATILPQVLPIHRDFASKLYFIPSLEGSAKEKFDRIDFMMKYGIKAEMVNTLFSDSSLKAIFFQDSAPNKTHLLLKDPTKYAIFTPFTDQKPYLIFKPLIKDDFELVIIEDLELHALFNPK